MTVRADVAELLHAGYGDRTIARQLGITPTSVTRARTELHLPKARGGIKAAETPEDLFWRRVQPAADGHMTWTGNRTNKGTPVCRFGGRANGRTYSAYQIAYRIRYGTTPSGHARVICGRPDCVAPDHVGDSSDLPLKTFADRWPHSTVPTDDGHLLWTGRLRDGITPVMVHRGRDYSARRAGFEVLHGRDADGMVLPGCGRRDCVRPEHMEDQPMRARLRTQYDAIFGSTS